MNIFARIRERREQRHQLARYRQFTQTFADVQKLERSHLLIWEQKHRRLFIAEPLAIVMLAQGAEAWRHFLNNIYLYQMHRLQTKQWEDHVRDEEVKAVRKRKREVAVLTKAETERIRRAVRDDITADAVPLPPIEAFEFYILADAADDPQHARITFVGEYDPDTELLDMVEWKQVKHAIETSKNDEQ